MNDTPVCNSKSLILRWLLIVTLLLNFFTFSAFTPHTQINPEKPLTTLVINLYRHHVKGINYKQVLNPVQSKHLEFICCINVEYLYTQWVEIQIKELKNAILPLQTNLFYKTKSISQNTDDELAILIG